MFPYIRLSCQAEAGIKRGKEGLVLRFYGFFLNSSTPSTAIAMIMATVLATKYISVEGTTTSGYGDAVAVGPATLM
jgi:hypothetical protein